MTNINNFMKGVDEMVLLFRNKGIGNGVRKLFSDALANICTNIGYHDVIFNELSRIDINDVRSADCDMIRGIQYFEEQNDYLIWIKDRDGELSCFKYNDLINEMKRLLLEDIDNTLFCEDSIKISSNTTELYDNYNKIQPKYIDGRN